MNQTWSVRPYKEGDEKEIFELTKVVWGYEVPEKERWMRGWRWLHLDNPAGTSIIWLAKHNGKTVGVHLLVMINMKIRGGSHKGGEPVDTMTHPEYRYQGISSTLGRKLLSEAEKKGICLEFAFPNQQNYPVRMKSGWFDVCAFQVMIKPLNLKNILRKYFVRNRLLLNIFTTGGNLIIKAFFRSKKVPGKVMSKVKEVSHFDDRISEFWDTISNDYDIIVVRNKKYLNWRYVYAPNADYTIYIAEESGNICGYIVLGCGNKDNLRWGYIYDIIASTEREDIIQCLLTKAVEYFMDAGVDAIFSKMVTNEICRKGLSKNGFIPHFRFKGRFVAYNTFTKLFDVFLKNSKNWFIQLGDLSGVY